MTCMEETLLFGCGQDTLFGILALPETSGTMAVIVVVGGPQYRVGSHRQFVHLARALANAGYAALRFDFRGMGDSQGEARSFEHVQDDICAAIDALQARLPSVRHVALWGLCDAASAALLYSHEAKDARVRVLCLLNPWVRSQASLARTHIKHYYLQRLTQPAFWGKFLRGQVAAKAARDLANNLHQAAASALGGRAAATAHHNADRATAPFQPRMAAAWHAFAGKIVVLLSVDDYTAKEFVEATTSDAAWRKAWQRKNLVRHDLAGADHTLSNTAHRTLLEQLTIQELQHDDHHTRG